MSSPFPHHYETDLVWHADRLATLSGPGLPAISGGPPPQFDGSEGQWSPEHLLLASTSLCLMTTFFTLARREHVQVIGYEDHAEAVLDKTREGIVFTSIILHVAVRVADASQVEPATRLLHAAKRYCIVSNALKPEIELRGSVTTP